jgi:hypothetical protein
VPDLETPLVGRDNRLKSRGFRDVRPHGRDEKTSDRLPVTAHRTGREPGQIAQQSVAALDGLTPLWPEPDSPADDPLS